MTSRPSARLAAIALLATSATSATSGVASAQETAPPAPAPATPAPAPSPAALASEVKLDLVIGEVKMLALDETKSWSVAPEVGLASRAMDEGRTLRLVAQKDGLYTVRIEHNDGSVVSYVVRIGKEATVVPGPVIGPPTVPKIDPNAPPPSLGNSADEKYTRDAIDLNLEGGAGRQFGDDPKTVGFGRARVGVMFARWPLFKMIGATYEYNNLSPATFGLQAELLHLSAGVWAQVGGMVDIHAKAGVMGSLGFSVIGVEAQYRGYEDIGYGFAVLGKLRIPVGVFLYAFDLNKKK